MRGISTSDLLILLSALKWTCVLVSIALIMGAVSGLVLAILRSSQSVFYKIISTIFIELVQGIPLLCLLMFFYFGLPVFLQINLPAIIAVAIAYTIYTAAFLGDIWRGGIQSVKYAQWEAAASLGLSKFNQFFYVIWPQAFKTSLPACVGFIVQLIKNTSLASVVGFIELARAGQIISAGTFRPLLVYSLVALIYFSICFPLTIWSRNLERRLNASTG